MRGYVSINGVVSDAANARVSVFDRAYLHGDGVFEVLAGYDGRPLHAGAHVARLYRSAAMIHLALPWSQEELCAELNAMAARLPTGRSYLRLAVSAGLGMGMVRPRGDVQKTIYCLQLAPTVHHPCALQTVPRQHNTLLAAKTPSYVEAIAAIAAAQSNGYDDILWLNTSNHVAEAATANIFFVATDGEQLSCHTPHAETGLLSGLTAQRVSSTLAEHGIEVVERAIHRDEVKNFSAAFLSSSVQGVRAVQRINNHRYATDSEALCQIVPLLDGTTYPPENTAGPNRP